MVSFTCNSCGNTVKKNQVEKHYQNECPSCDVLSCMDCGLDFVGNAYVSHTSCISEAEKYQGKLYQPKGKQNKGDEKQKGWMQQVQNASSGNVNPRLKGYLKRISEYSNVPRKKAKFENFCRNSMQMHDQKTLDDLWNHFNPTSNNNNQVTLPTTAIDTCVTHEKDDVTNGKFRWHKVIKRVMKESNKESISIKKMKRKVIAEYNNHCDEKLKLSLEECNAKFLKKLSTYSKIKIAKDRVWFNA